MRYRVFSLAITLAAVALSAVSSSQVSLKWSRSFNDSPNHSNSMGGMTIDSSGNIYICGTEQQLNNKDLSVVKYDPSGNVLWSKLYDGGRDDTGQGVAVDAGGNVYVCGSTYTSNSDSDFLTIKYDSGGNLLWTETYNGANDQETPVGIHLDAINNVYVAGQSGTGGGADLAVVKYSKDGALRFATRINNGGIDLLHGFSLDPASGNSYLAAESDYVDNGSTYEGAFVAKLNSAGTELWGYTDPGNSHFSEALACTYTPGGDLVYTGERLGTDNDLLVGKINANGTLAWSKILNSGNGDDEGNSVVLGTDGSVYIGGAYSAPITQKDFAVYKWTGTGTFNSVYAFDGGNQSDDEANSITIDSYGRLYFSGIGATSGSTGQDVIVYSMDSANMTLAWGTSYSTPGLDNAVALAFDPVGYPIVAGEHDGDFLTLKFSELPIALADSYSLKEQTTLTVNPPGVLANDHYAKGGTAVLVTDVSHGVLTLSSDGGFLYSPQNQYIGSDSFTYKVNRSGDMSTPVTVNLVVTGAVPTNLTFNPSTVIGGNDSTGTVTLSAAAPISGAIVDISDNSSAASGPLTVTVPSGQTSVTFTVNTTVQDHNVPVTFTATRAGVSAQRMLNVNGCGMVGFGLSPSTVVGGDSSTGTVTLGGPAPNGGRVVTLASLSSVISVPPSVTVPSGATTATFTANTVALSSDATRYVTATAGSITKSAALTILAPVLSTFTIAPSTVVGGAPATGTVTLTGKAPSGGRLVTLSSSTAVIVVPPSVTVAAGGTSANFAVQTKSVVSQVVRTVSASCGGVTKNFAMTLNPGQVLTSFTANPSTVVGGSPTTGTVTISGPAPGGGAVVALSSGSSVIVVPPSVTIPAGLTSVNFTITTKAVASTVVRTATASYNGVSKTVSITLTP